MVSPNQATIFILHYTNFIFLASLPDSSYSILLYPQLALVEMSKVLEETKN
jgi:hypothetical protein